MPRRKGGQSQHCAPWLTNCTVKGLTKWAEELGSTPRSMVPVSCPSAKLMVPLATANAVSAPSSPINQNTAAAPTVPRVLVTSRLTERGSDPTEGGATDTRREPGAKPNTPAASSFVGMVTVMAPGVSVA